jgi:hypothetical protein
LFDRILGLLSNLEPGALVLARIHHIKIESGFLIRPKV